MNRTRNIQFRAIVLARASKLSFTSTAPPSIAAWPSHDRVTTASLRRRNDAILRASFAMADRCTQRQRRRQKLAACCAPLIAGCFHYLFASFSLLAVTALSRSFYAMPMTSASVHRVQHRCMRHELPRLGATLLGRLKGLCFRRVWWLCVHKHTASDWNWV